MKWGKWVLEEAKKEIGDFFPSDKNNSVPVAYLASRTLPCQNPSCGAEMPLKYQYWLARNKKNRIVFFSVKNNLWIQN